MKVTKLGHCCLLIEVRGIRFLTDPGNYTVAQNTVQNINYIVISHEHTDHLHIESLKIVLTNNPSAKVICNNSVGKILETESIPYTKLSDGESITLNGVTLSGYGITHALIYKDYEQVENTGYMFDEKLFYPGDAFHNPRVPVDILAFPVSGPWCTISDAVNYAVEIKPRIAFPVHDGNLIKKTGITVRLPGLILPTVNTRFIVLEEGIETEM
ncbi:MAG: MBL fold metallo-hydrolase [bacterium]|nr:MBL fold metallo-hydrolase [bacterium]